MNPTLYDILGVRPDASADQVKRAWRDAADRFEPGSGSSGAQFRLFNEAAEVLLDPARRKEYDAQLAAEGRSPAAGAAQEPEPEPVRLEKDRPREPQAVAPAGRTEPAPALPATDAAPAEGTGERFRPSWPLLAGLGALALVLVATAAVLGLVTWPVSDVRAQDSEQDATRTAPAAAERAAAAILSYDYKSLDTDEKAAERYMTAAYAKQYADTFDKLVRGNAEKLHAKVEAQVRASGVSHADADRVNVLVFVNQVTTSTANAGQEQTALNRVEFAMVRQDGAWKVNHITSY